MTSGGDMLDIWGAAMWRASWQGGLAALIVAFICRLRPSIPAWFQCWMWRLAMLKFAVAFVWSVPVEIPVLPSSEPVVSAVVSVPIPFSDDTPTIDERTPSDFPLMMVPFTIWVVIVAWQMGRILVSCRNARLLKSRCRASENRQILDPCSRLSKMLGLLSPPLVLEIEGEGSPLLVGILRPAIVLPKETLERLDASERSLVLGHELAHVSRYDLFCSLVSAMIRALFFFHPAAWFSERRLGVTQEIAADQLAIALQKQSPIHYAQLLLAIVGKLGPRRTTLTMSMGTAGENDSLYQRLSAMRYIKQTTPRIVLAYCLLIGLGSVLGLVPWSLGATTASAAEETKPTKQKEQTEAIVHGRYASFKDGVLRVNVQDDRSDVVSQREWKLADDIKVVSHRRSGATEWIARDAFKQWQQGGSIALTINHDNVVFIELGTKNAWLPKPEQSREPPIESKSDNKEIVTNAKMHQGRFVSFKNGTLMLETNSAARIESKVFRHTKTAVWNDSTETFVPRDTIAALKQVKVGTVIVVNGAGQPGNLRIGSRKGITIGTFVSYENDRLLMLGENLGERFTKRYGNRVHFNKFREDVPAYQSIDGGDYRLIGMANEILGRLETGSVLRVFSEGDDNITLVQVDAKKM